MPTKQLSRWLIMAFFLFFLFSVIFWQFYHLQLIEGEDWVSRANRQYHHRKIELPQRGSIFASGYYGYSPNPVPQLLASDAKQFHLYLDPLSIPQECRVEMVDKICSLLDLESRFSDELRGHLEKQSRCRCLRYWITSREKESLLSWWNSYSRQQHIPYNAFYFQAGYRRVYPCGSLAGALLHSVRYTPKETRVPTGGLESYFNSLLRGKEKGHRIEKRGLKHVMDSQLERKPSRDGQDLYLTLDAHIQLIAEQEIEAGVKKAQAKGGWALLMEPYTGEIVALAQYPSFFPSRYSEYYAKEDLMEATRIHAIADTFEPGSPMKALSMVIALMANEDLCRRGESPLFSLEEMFDVRNGHFPGRQKPISDIGSYRYLNAFLAIQRSSCVYIARLMQRVVERMGPVWYQKQLENCFGFGHRLGIEFPAEGTGFFPKVGKKDGKGRREWVKATPFSLAMGYNLSVTGIQMAASYCAIANGGFQIRPTLVKSMSSSHGNVSKEDKRLFSQETSQQVICLLKAVTKQGGGTSSLADIPGYTQAGKSGTSEKNFNGIYSQKVHFSTFIGIAPASHPRFVLMIAIDEPAHRHLPGLGRTYFGGQCASPVFKAIMTRVFDYMQLQEDDPFGYPRGDPRADPSRADWAVEMKELHETYRKWNLS